MFRTVAVPLLSAAVALLVSPLTLSVEETVVWDMKALGRLDKTNKAYEIVSGRVSVDLVSGKTLCPSGLGPLASGMANVEEIAIHYEVSEAGEYTLQVTWDPGGSGQEQFEVFSNGKPAATSEVVDGGKTPERETKTRVALTLAKGAQDAVIHRLSGDGLNIRNIALKAGPPEAQNQPAATETPETSPESARRDEAAENLTETGPCPTDEDPSAAPGKVIWDMNELGRFDATDKAYPIKDGRVSVDINSDRSLCPTGLGSIASNRPDVREISMRYKADEAGECFLHVAWDPGGSGEEQFEALANGRTAGKSRLVFAEKTPNARVGSAFKFRAAKGANEIVLRYLSGNGLHFKRLALTTSVAPLASQTFAVTLKWPTLAAFSKECGEPGVVIDSEHVRLFAPKRREKDAQIVMPYLVKAYDELYKIVGMHTRYKIVVYNFTRGNPNGWGGTSSESGSIEYSEKNLDLVTQAEWQRHGVPHVSGYIEEMAHNFVQSSGAKFGWEMIGWSLGARVTNVVAGNPVHAKQVEETRRGQAETYKRYKALGNTVPPDLPYNQCDRIHAYVLWECEKKYGDNFWRDFFMQVAKEKERLNAPVPGGNDETNNYRNQITVECFDRLKGVGFRKRLTQDGISATVYVRSLHPEKPGWNRKLQ